MRLITPYTPPTFNKPCLIVSTAFTNNEHSTSIKFVTALNTNEALSICFSEATIKSIERVTKKQIATDWIVVKSHRSIPESLAYHMKLTTKMTEGGNDEISGKGYKEYLRLYKKYCPFKLNEDKNNHDTR